MKASATLLAVAMLAVGCSGADSENVVDVGSESGPSPTAGLAHCFAGEASGRPCEPAVPLPAGLARVEVRLDLDSMPGADDTAIDVLVTERGCASGREMGDALRAPQVIETDEAVLVAFAVVPVAGGANCRSR